jgi:hypothetical protein
MIKKMLIIFFDIKDIVHISFTPQGHTIIQAYYMEILKGLSEAVHSKRPEFWTSDWILHHDNAPAYKSVPMKQFLAQNRLLKWNAHSIP